MESNKIFLNHPGNILSSFILDLTDNSSAVIIEGPTKLTDIDQNQTVSFFLKTEFEVFFVLKIISK